MSEAHFSVPANDPESIPALAPRGSGHQFVVCSGSCSGVPGEPEMDNHRRLNETLARLSPVPEFVAFPGDAVMNGADGDQWSRWFELMRWATERDLPILQSTSNHNTYDDLSTEVYRRFWPGLPQNGPAGQAGLAYWWRKDELLYVSLHQPSPLQIPWPGPLASMQTGISEEEAAWLESVLDQNADARWKFVAGHHPVFPVNGYTLAPLWCFTPEARSPLWSILVGHGVLAYLSSHVMAFDVQVHDGVLQLSTEGGGGVVRPSGSLMPGPEEYHHAVQVCVDDGGLRYQVIDKCGCVRESLAWPIPDPGDKEWAPPRAASGSSSPDDVVYVSIAEPPEAPWWQQEGTRPLPNQPLITWLATTDGRIVVGVDAESWRLTVTCQMDDIGPQLWRGPEIDPWAANEFEIAFHPAMGPGGVLWRKQGHRPWTSMATSSARGIPDPTTLKDGHVTLPGLRARCQSAPANAPSLSVIA